MMKNLLILIFICFSLIQVSCSNNLVVNDTTITFAGIDEGREILTAPDEFVRNLSPFDRAARLKTDNSVSQEEFLAFVGKSVRQWKRKEKQQIVAALEGVQENLDNLSLPLPEQVLLVKTTGDEEGGVAYTRANAIVLPEHYLSWPVEKLQKTISHELFHIITRTNPDLREKLYAAIGFEKCREIDLPEELKLRKITNPDAPKSKHYIRIRAEGEEHWAIPVIFSRAENYDMAQGGVFFSYLKFRFLLVDLDDDTSTCQPLYDDRTPRLVRMRDIFGFFEQTGINTEYIIHPEEILASNFALLVLQEQDLPSPEVVNQMQNIFKQ